MPIPPAVRRPLAILIVAGVMAVAMSAQSDKPTAAGMSSAATAFLATLPAEQKAKATFGFDDPHRLKWYFTPQQTKDRQSTRKGVKLEDLPPESKTAALTLLRTGLSATGYEQARTIMSLEALLAELEGQNGAMVRNPGWYFVSVFGEPSATGQWGWRIEGHHLSVNFTLDKGEVVASSPVLLAANPAEVKTGTRKGLKALPEIETLAVGLIGTLTADQNKSARLTKHLPEIKEGQPDAAVGQPVGIPAKELTAEQKAALWKLVEAYANRLPAELARAELAKAKDAGPDAIHFAYCREDDKPNRPLTYRVQGPTFVVEFLNVQADSAKNPANHIHSGWRALPRDFGLAR